MKVSNLISSFGNRYIKCFVQSLIQNIYSKSLIKYLLGLLFLSMGSRTLATEINTKSLATDMIALNRSLDLLFAREEMKDSASYFIFQNSIRGLSLNSDESTNSVDSKVAAITNAQSMKNCEVLFSQKRSPSDDKIDTILEYKGVGCPVAIKGSIHVVTGKGEMNGDVIIEIQLLSPELKKDLDVEKYIMPAKVKIQVKPLPDGFEMNTLIGIAGKLYSQKVGLIEYSAEILNGLSFGGKGMGSKAQINEKFIGSGTQITFAQIVEQDQATKTEKFYINSKEVTQLDFNKQHDNIKLPGFESNPEPLSRIHKCEVRGYDQSQYSIDKVRESIKNNTIDSIPVTETLEPIQLSMTGKISKPIQFAGSQMELEIAVTLDAARFNFFSAPNRSGARSSLGKLTAVLGDKLELTKQIMNRIVRISCLPK